MRRYTIARIPGTPDWADVPPLRVDNALWVPAGGVRMEQRLCYNAHALCVYQRAWETDIRAEYSAPLSPVHEDSCMEFFFRPRAMDVM